MTNNGSWVVFGPKAGFLYRCASDQRVTFGNTPTGWNWTFELEAPSQANQKVLEAIERRSAEKELPKAVPRDKANLPDDLPEKVRMAICMTPFGGQAWL